METRHPPVNVTPTLFGDAICRFVGLQMGSAFFPYRITKSSVCPPLGPIQVEIEDKPLSGAVAFPPRTAQHLQDRFVVTLTDAEVSEALSYEISLFHLGVPYRGNVIAKLPQGYCGGTFQIEYMPRGTTIDEKNHAFGGL